MEPNATLSTVVEHPIDVASRALGGRNVLADQLGVSVMAIGNWKFRGIPAEHCKTIELLTSGAVTCQEMRPNDWHKYWPELAGSIEKTTTGA